MAIIARSKKTFFSRPYQQRIGRRTVGLEVCLAWCVIALGISMAVKVAPHSVTNALLLLLPVLCAAAYLLWSSKGAAHDSHKRHELLIDGEQIVLSTYEYDHREETRVIQQISGNAVTSAEYSKAGPDSALLLRGPDSSLEIPLWTFGSEIEKEIVDELQNDLGIFPTRKLS